jgi:hypothetical protein
MAEQMEVITFRAPPGQRAALAEIAARDGRTMSNQLRMLLKLVLEADRVQRSSGESYAVARSLPSRE